MTMVPIISYGRFTRRSLAGWHLEVGRFTERRWRLEFRHNTNYAQLRIGTGYLRAFRRGS